MDGSDVDDDFVNPFWPTISDKEYKKRKNTADGVPEKKKTKGPGCAAGSNINESIVSTLTSAKNSPETPTSSHGLSNGAELSLPRKQTEGIVNGESLKPPNPMQYNSEYGSLAVKLINMGLIKFMRASLPQINDTGSSESFTDLLRGNEKLQRYFETDATSGSLEVSLTGMKPFVTLRGVLKAQKRGPYGLFVWINIHDKPPNVIYGARKPKIVQNQYNHHQLVGFIYREGDIYGAIVRSRLGWIDVNSHQLVKQLHCMKQLSSKAVSLLYGYHKPELYTPAPVAKKNVFYLNHEEQVSLSNSLSKRGLEEYVRTGNYTVRNEDQFRIYHFDQWKQFGSRILNVDANINFEMNCEQRNELRKIILEGRTAFKDIIPSNGPPSTIHIKGDNFFDKVVFENGRLQEHWLCQYCLCQYYTTDQCGNWVCFRHVPVDGIFCIFYYHPSPVQVDIFIADHEFIRSREASIRSRQTYSKICGKFYAASAEEAMQSLLAATCLGFVRNALYCIQNSSTLFRQRYMSLTPRYFKTDVDAMCRLLGMKVSVVPLKEAAVSDQESMRLGILFPPDGERHPDFPYVYVKEYERDGSTLFYVGKMTTRIGMRVCDSKREFGVHIGNTVVVQTPSSSLLDTLESAVQLAYSLAFILSIKKGGKEFAVANNLLEKGGALIGDSTYLDYVKVIFRHQFGQKLVIERRK